MKKEKLIFRLKILGWSLVALICLFGIFLWVPIAIIIVLAKYVCSGKSTFPFSRDIPLILSIRKKLSVIKKKVRAPQETS